MLVRAAIRDSIIRYAWCPNLLSVPLTSETHWLLPSLFSYFLFSYSFLFISPTQKERTPGPRHRRIVIIIIVSVTVVVAVVDRVWETTTGGVAGWLTGWTLSRSHTPTHTTPSDSVSLCARRIEPVAFISEDLDPPSVNFRISENSIPWDKVVPLGKVALPDTEDEENEGGVASGEDVIVFATV